MEDREFISVYEPTMSHLTEKRGETVDIDVVDRDCLPTWRRANVQARR
jgi:hypothetical protein